MKDAESGRNGKGNGKGEGRGKEIKRKGRREVREQQTDPFRKFKLEKL